MARLASCLVSTVMSFFLFLNHKIVNYKERLTPSLKVMTLLLLAFSTLGTTDMLRHITTRADRTAAVAHESRRGTMGGGGRGQQGQCKKHAEVEQRRSQKNEKKKTGE